MSNAPQTPDFALRVEDGRGALVLADETFFGWLRVDRLELEIPNVSFPLDVAGGAARFQRRRCRVAGARLSVDDRALEALIRARAAGLGAAGFDDVRLRLLEDAVEISARARVDERSADFTARGWVEAGERALRLVVADVRVFGFVRRPGPVLAHALLGALFDAAPAGTTDEEREEVPAARWEGLAELELSPLDALL
jgi:hypothetical protein